jgi:tetratricopeptide (TPR) repeat protein
MLRRVITPIGLALLIGGCAGDPVRVAEQFVARGDDYMNAGRYDAAILEYRNALKTQPEDFKTYLKLGEAQQLQGRTTDAFRTFSKASEIDAKDPRPRIEAGRMLLASGHAAAAEARAELVLRADPGNADAEVLLALARSEQRKWDEAEKALTIALDRSPQSVWAHVATANVLLATDRTAEAVTHLKAAVEANPQDELANRAMAAHYMAAGSAENAEPFFVTAAAQVPQRYRSSLALADFYAADGRFDEARAVLSAAAENRALSTQHSDIKQRLSKLASQ